VTVRLLGGLLITVMTLYAPPRTRTGKGRGKEGGGLYPELAAFRISEGCSPNVQSEVGRSVGLLPIACAQEELARRGLELDEKAVHRIAVQLGYQMLATRTRDLMRYRAGELPAGTEFAGKRVAVQIDGGRVRIRRVVKKSRVGKTRKRRKFRVEWREPKVVVLLEIDEKGRMVRGSQPVIDGTLRGPDALIELVAFHLHRLGAAQAKEVVFVADGAPWIWARLDWVMQQVGLAVERTFQVLDWCHAVHHVSLALEALRLGTETRRQTYARLRGLLKQGKAEEMIAELQSLAVGRPHNQVLRREIRYFTKHAEAGRLRYVVFRYRRLPIGSGAIESTIRRVINLRLKGNGIYWTEENAEAVFQLRAAVLSRRWEQTLAHTRAAIACDRRRAWHWQPPAALAELKALEAQARKEAQAIKRQRPTRTAA
jgi:hypothetical protein